MFLRNRRVHLRKSVQAEGWIAGTPEDVWRTIQVVDVSKGGFAFFNDVKLTENSTWHFRLLLPGSSRLMNLTGRIRNCLEHHNPDSYRVSVQFKQIDVADATAIEWFVEHTV